MLRNESVKVYELPTGFTLEATVSSSDSEITQWLLLQVSAFQPLSIKYYRFKRLIVDIADMLSKRPGFAYQHV